MTFYSSWHSPLSVDHPLTVCSLFGTVESVHTAIKYFLFIILYNNLPHRHRSRCVQWHTAGGRVSGILGGILAVDCVLVRRVSLHCCNVWLKCISDHLLTRFQFVSVLNASWVRLHFHFCVACFYPGVILKYRGIQIKYSSFSKPSSIGPVLLSVSFNISI